MSKNLIIKFKQGRKNSIHSRSLMKEMANINGLESDTTVDLDTLQSIGLLVEELRSTTSCNNEQVEEIKYLLDNYDYRKDEKLSEILIAF